MPSRDAEVDDDLAQLLEVGDRFVGAAHVRLGDDFEEGRAGAVEVDVAVAAGLGAFAVQELAGVLLHVDAGDAEALAAVLRLDIEPAADADRLFELGDLVALGEVGVEVVLAGKDRALGDGAVGGQAGHDREFDDLLVQHRQSAGEAEADRAGLGIRLAAEAGGTAAEDLGLGLELDMDFQADDDFIFRGHDRFLYARLSGRTQSAPPS